MPFYRVRPSQSLGISGKSFYEGDVVELTPEIAAEIKEKVDLCDEQGELIGTSEVPDVATLPAHERLDVLTKARQKAADTLAKIDAAIAEAESSKPPAKRS